MESEKPKPPLVRLNEATTNIGEALQKLQPHIARIAATGVIDCSGPDIQVMLACTRYVAAQQAAGRVLERLSE
jgi:hypothetical protein